MIAELADRLRAAGLDPGYVERTAVSALQEDLQPPPGGAGGAGGVDVTSVATIPAGAEGVADLLARAEGVVAGLLVAEVVFRASTDRPVEVTHHAADGARVRPGDVLLTVAGPARALLTAERAALNLLCHLSGVATLTAQWVDAVAGTGVRIRDTRKTTPGLRACEKYAVRRAGGVNHRMGVTDAALIKDNHVAAAGSVTAALAAVREAFPAVPVEVECDTLEQVAEAVAAGADLILCDNMDAPELAEAVDAVAGRARLEASGGLSLTVAAEVAATGVDYLSVGALTHSAPALDIAMDLRPGAGPDAPEG